MNLDKGLLMNDRQLFLAVWRANGAHKVFGPFSKGFDTSVNPVVTFSPKQAREQCIESMTGLCTRMVKMDLQNDGTMRQSEVALSIEEPANGPNWDLLKELP